MEGNYSYSATADEIRSCSLYCRRYRIELCVYLDSYCLEGSFGRVRSVSSVSCGDTELQKLAGVINRTTGYQTITTTGIKEYYGSVFDTLRNKPGYESLKKFDDNQLADILKTEGWESMKRTVGSEQAFRMVGSVDSADKIMGWLDRSGGGQSISSYVKDFNEFTGSGYEWQPATAVPF